MEWYWAWYVLGPDTNTMKTPSHICAASVWIWKGGIKKNSRNIFSKEHVFYCDSSRGPNFFKPQTRPLLENLINIVVGGTVKEIIILPVAFQNALKLICMCLVHIQAPIKKVSVN